MLRYYPKCLFLEDTTLTMRLLCLSYTGMWYRKIYRVPTPCWEPVIPVHCDLTLSNALHFLIMAYEGTVTHVYTEDIPASILAAAAFNPNPRPNPTSRTLCCFSNLHNLTAFNSKTSFLVLRALCEINK